MAAALDVLTGVRLAMATGSYVAERDDWPAAVARVRAEGWRSVELTAITEERLRTLRSSLFEPGFAAGFERISIHAPARFESSAAECLKLLAECPFDIVLHPDLYARTSAVGGLGARAVFENMDVAKSFGRTLEDLERVFHAFPEACLCLDVAHVWTNDPTMELGAELLDAFGDRLRQLHVSGIEPDGTHRPTTEVDLSRYAPLLERCAGVPWVLEAVFAEEIAWHP